MRAGSDCLLDDVHWMVLLKLIFVTFISYLQYIFGQIFLWMVINIAYMTKLCDSLKFCLSAFLRNPSKNGGRVLTKSGLAIYAPFALVKLCRICQSGRLRQIQQFCFRIPAWAG